jgi:hypothetical protein
MAKWTQQICIAQVDTRSFRVVAGNKLHVPGRLDLGGPLCWVFAWGIIDFSGSRY